MKNFRLFVYSLLWGNPELFLLDQARLGFHRFFRERTLPGQVPSWQARLPRNASQGLRRFHAVGGRR